MDIFVLTEPGVMDATWAGQYADGIRTQALTLKYRVLELRWPNVAASAGHTVIVNGFSRRFYRAADPAVRAAGGVPLWLAPADVCVHPDFTGATAGLLKQLKNAGCERIAFFGANPDSLNDGPKLTVYRGSGGRDVFYNRGDLRDCFRAFASRGGVFDGILFPDGVTAAVFLRCLKESGGSAAGLKIGVPGEFGGRTDAEVFRAVYDCGEVGRRAVMCVRLLEQNEYARFSAVVPVRIPGLRPSVPAPASVPAVDFFADGAVREALRFERLMHACGDADRAILKRLCDGWSYSRIGRTLYMSNQNVRYRVRRLLTLSGYADTADMLADYAAYGP